MPSVVNPKIIRLSQKVVLCDEHFSPILFEGIFCPQKLEEMGLLTGKAVGRGEAWFFDCKGMSLVLRHFRRGGLVSRLISDRYFGWNLEKTRAWAEWYLLAELYRLGLPVPRPVAAAVCRGYGTYRADLLMERIPDSIALASLLSKEAQSKRFWLVVGQCLRQFHDHGVYHADLNANNILVRDRSQIYLIDFDKGEIRNSGKWKQQNLNRLKRSLLKIKGSLQSIHFCEEDWTSLLQGYETHL